MKRLKLKETVKLSALALLVSFVMTSGLLAQGVADNPSRGSKAGHSYSVGDLETINLTNGNLMINFPLGSLPAGRGEVSGGISLVYNSKLYDIQTHRVPETRPALTGLFYNKSVIVPATTGGWRYATGYRLEGEDRMASYGGNPPSCGSSSSDPFWQVNRFRYKSFVVTPDGARHEMIPIGYDDQLDDGFYEVKYDGKVTSCPNIPVSIGTPLTFYSIDGTYLRLEVAANGTDWTLYFPDGKKATHDGKLYDRNGNYVQNTSWTPGNVTDQLGRSVTTSSDTNGDHLITSEGVGGEDVVWRVKWRQIWVKKTYQGCRPSDGQSPGAPCPDEGYIRTQMSPSGPISITVVDKIIQPSQLGSGEYIFEYNGSNTYPTGSMTPGWGELSKITLPTGAYVTYKYKMDDLDGPVDFEDTKDILKNHVTEKNLTYDLEYDAPSTPTTETWTYNIDTTYGTMTGPNGAVSTELFESTEASIPSCPLYQCEPNPLPWTSGLAYSTTNPDGSVTERLWARNRPSSISHMGGYTAFNPYVKTEFTSIKSGSSFTLTAIKDYTYDKNGNVTEVKEYDWIPYATAHPGGVATVPSGTTYLRRITKTEFYNASPEASTTTYSDTDSYHVTSSPRLLRLAKSVEVQDANNTPKARSEMTYDNTNYASSNTKGGNLTESKAWDSWKDGASRAYSNPLTTTNSISTSTVYNSYGMPTSTTDANGNVSTITYGYINGYYDLYPTQTVRASGAAVARTSSAVYDFHTGSVTTATDNDNNVSTITEYDALGRTTKVRSAANTALESWTQTIYNDTARRTIVKSDLEIVGDAKKVAIQHFDQMGKVRLSRTLEDAATQSATDETHGVKVQTRYTTDSGYAYSLKSNPYRANYSYNETDATMGWSRTKTVNTGRQSQSETFTGASLPAPWGSNSTSTGIVSTDIDAERTLVTDQAGKQRISKTNGIGQMTDVWEIKASDASTVSVAFPGTSIGYGYQTSYTYDTLNNLATVSQGSQTRSFAYSSLSRLRTAANPESGTITYGYDSNGNLSSKVDARSITTSYSYDALNRPTQRGYSNDPTYTPTVTYTYDNLTNAKGKLTKVASSVSTTEYTSFDISGRVTASKQITDGVAYGNGTTDSLMTYKYNLGGALTEQQYPSGRVVKNTLDTSGDLAMVQSKKNTTSGYWSYADSFAYNAAGAMTSLQLGNGKWESTQFNARLQPTQIALGTVQNGTDKLDLAYSYGSTSNNGNVQSQTISVTRAGQSPLVLNQTYTYDGLNRLEVAEEKTGTTTNWKQTFVFDRYGNRNFNQSQTTTPTFADPDATNPSANTSNNRLASIHGYVYDAAGNLTTDADSRTFTYDAENKQVAAKNAGAVTIGDYYFDGGGRRVKKVIPASGETTVFVYDAGGKLVAEFSTNIVPTKDAKVQFLTNDNLETPRVNTDAGGNVTSRNDYMPYGEEIASLGGRSTTEKYVTDDVRQGYTGYLKDEETGLDFAKARMYSNTVGRFAGVDPMPLKSQFLTNPQNLNRYAYTRNSPLSYTDSSGHCSVPAGLKKGQVGICIEAFISSARLGGIGHGDGRSHNGNDPDLSARMRLKVIVSLTPEAVRFTVTERMISPSKAGVSTGPVSTGGGPVVQTEAAVSAQGTGNVGISNTSTNSRTNSDNFGTSTSFRASLENGTNGFQQAGRDMQSSEYRSVQQLGAIVEAASPQGTIDANLQINISGPQSNPTVFATGESRSFPSYTGYAYTVNDDGSHNTIELFRRDETVYTDLPKPMTPIKPN